MNQCHFIGNLVRDPELTNLKNNVRKVKFTIAVNRKYKNKSTGQMVDDPAFLEMEAWDTGADLIVEHFIKGDTIIISSASAKTESWEDKETGKKRSKTLFRVNQFEFPRGGKRRDEDNDDAAEGNEPVAASTSRAEDEIPF